MISIKILKACLRLSSSKSVFQLGAQGAAESRDENIRQASFVFAKQADFFMGLSWASQEKIIDFCSRRAPAWGGLTAARSDVVETFCRPKKLTQQRKVIKLKKKLRLQSTNQPPSCSLLWTRHRVSLTATRVPCGTGRRGCWELCQTVKLDKTMHLSIVILPMMWRCC